MSTLTYFTKTFPTLVCRPKSPNVIMNDKDKHFLQKARKRWVWSKWPYPVITSCETV